jgi:hypothetical protein
MEYYVGLDVSLKQTSNLRICFAIYDHFMLKLFQARPGAPDAKVPRPTPALPRAKLRNLTHAT